MATFYYIILLYYHIILSYIILYSNQLRDFSFSAMNDIQFSSNVNRHGPHLIISSSRCVQVVIT